MKQLFPGFILLLFSSCAQNPKISEQGRSSPDTLKVAAAPVSADTMVKSDDADPANEVAPFYLVQIATGYNFDSLKSISLNAASILGTQFNMLDRIYKPGKGIIVPDSSDDEIYRGDYYPRRPYDDQNFVSIEMWDGFNKESDTLKMVVFAGIYSLKRRADSVTLLLKDKIPTTKTIRRELYMGCMH